MFENILNHILSYLSITMDFLDKVQDVFYVFAIPLIFYVFLLLRKLFRKKWIESKKLMLSVKLVLLIPFWIIYIYYAIPFAVPEIENLIKPSDSSQKILVESTEDVSQKFMLIGRKYKSDEWVPVYQNQFDINKSAIYKVEANDLTSLSVRSGMKDYDIIAVSKLTGMSYPNDKFSGLAFSIPSMPIKIYTHQFNFNNPLEKPELNIKKQILLALLCLTAVFGLIYHSLSTRGKLYFTIPIYSLYAIFGLISAYLIYQISLTLWYLLL